MTYKGIARGKLIELEQPLPFTEGQALSVSVSPLAEDARRGSPEMILEAMRALPKVSEEEVAELERMIEEGKLPVRYEGIFDADT
jgi:hypothetical protein